MFTHDSRMEEIGASTLIMGSSHIQKVRLKPVVRSKISSREGE